MNLRLLNKICFVVCVTCIALACILSLVMIWGDIHDNKLVWKLWITIAILFITSALTLSVSKTYGLRDDPNGKA